MRLILDPEKTQKSRGRPARVGNGTHWAMVDLGVSTGLVVAGQIAPAVGYGGVFVAASSAPLIGLRVPSLGASERSPQDPITYGNLRLSSAVGIAVLL